MRNQTVDEIQADLKAAGKEVSRSMIYVYFNRLEIGPVGRGYPRRYPADSLEKIKKDLGLEAEPIAPKVTAKTLLERTARPTRLPTMAELRAERAKARKGKRGAK